jgi:hypothetical protein
LGRAVLFRVLRYQASCRNCYCLAIVIKICGRQELTSALKTDDNLSATYSPDKIAIPSSLTYQIIRRVNLFSGRPSYYQYKWLVKHHSFRSLSVDPEFYNSFVWIKNINIEECGLEL